MYEKVTNTLVPFATVLQWCSQTCQPIPDKPLVSPHERCENPWHLCQPHTQSNRPKWHWSPQTARCRFSQWGTRTQAASGTLQSNTRSPEQPGQGKGWSEQDADLHGRSMSPAGSPLSAQLQIHPDWCTGSNVQSESPLPTWRRQITYKIIFYVTLVVKVHFSETFIVGLLISAICSRMY